MNGWSRRWYIPVAWLALCWAVGNAVYVYLVLGGDRTFRIESAAFILAAVLLPLMLRPSSAAREPALTATDNRALIALSIVLWAATLAPYLTIPFLSDDYVFLAAYQRFADALRVGQFFRPLFAIVFTLLARVGNGSPVIFHAAAMLIHAASAWCVYVLSRRLLRRTDAAASCFALFLLNPLQLEAVLWISGLQDLLWTLFVLAGLVVYTGVQALSAVRLATTWLLVACALLSKETAVSAVLLLPAADWAFFRMKRGRLLPAAYAGVASLTAVYLFARMRLTSVESAFFVTPGKYFAQKFVATPYRFFAQPWNLDAVPIPAVVLCAVTVAAFAVLFAAVVRGAGPMTLAGPAVMLISTLPVYAYFYVAPDLRATRYLYFAAAGWAILVTHLLTTTWVRRGATLTAVVAVIGALFLSLQANIRPWRTAGEIVDRLVAVVRAGESPETVDWRAAYGDGLEIQHGLPTVYKGVYLFVNGYDELRARLADRR